MTGASTTSVPTSVPTRYLYLERIEFEKRFNETFCAMIVVFKYFIESIGAANSFEARKCLDWDSFRRGDCERQKFHMGDSASNTMRGTFFLRTNARPPYSDSSEQESVKVISSAL